MTVRDLTTMLNFEELCCPEPDREVTGGYCGDLLSWVMGRAGAGDAWITIMSNINVAAVAALTETSLVVFAEGVRPEQNVIEVAASKGVNLFTTALSAFDAAVTVGKSLGV